MIFSAYTARDGLLRTGTSCCTSFRPMRCAAALALLLARNLAVLSRATVSSGCETYRLHQDRVREDAALLLVGRKAMVDAKCPEVEKAFLRLGEKAGIFKDAKNLKDIQELVARHGGQHKACAAKRKRS